MRLKLLQLAEAVFITENVPPYGHLDESSELHLLEPLSRSTVASRTARSLHCKALVSLYLHRFHYLESLLGLICLLLVQFMNLCVDLCYDRPINDVSACNSHRVRQQSTCRKLSELKLSHIPLSDGHLLQELIHKRRHDCRWHHLVASLGQLESFDLLE